MQYTEIYAILKYVINCKTAKIQDIKVTLFYLWKIDKTSQPYLQKLHFRMTKT